MGLSKYLLAGSLCVLPMLATATSMPATSQSGYDLNNLDHSISPGDNFFGYADGGWNKANPIPDAYSRWGTFSILYQNNQKKMRAILEEAAADTKAPKGSIEQKIGDFYASGMDEASIDKAGLDPLKPEFKRIDEIKDMAGLEDEIARLHLMGVHALFSFGNMQDKKDSSKMIAAADQGGLGLPDRDYYLKKDKRHEKIRSAYVAHMGAMFGLLGENAKQAKTDAATVMSIEMGLAKASMTRVARRDPHATYHPTKLAKLQAMTPQFSWQKYFALVGIPEQQSVNVVNPKFFTEVKKSLKDRSLADWKTYLRWHLIDRAAPYLSKAFVDEDFKMNAVLSGAKKLHPRWQRVIGTEDWALGFAVGQKYVEKYFPPESKARVLSILHNVKGALKADLEKLSWMSPATRKAAIYKLSQIHEKIGYPDKWRDYSALEIDRGAYVLNVMRAAEFESHRELNKIGQPVDHNEWYMTPQTVNAYYDPPNNEIVFPAGILQPPFFNAKAIAAVNYGAAGVVMGHEITHGFDDQGSQYDAKGNLNDWWTKVDKKNFKERTTCIVDQFSGYTVNGDTHVQGKLVTGEAIADIGGVKLAYNAFQASDAGKAEQGKTYDGFTANQLFFLSFANVWASNIRPAEANRRITIDPHPPAKYRVNGTLADTPEFQQAFGIKDGAPMAPKHRCEIW